MVRRFQIQEASSVWPVHWQSICINMMCTASTKTMSLQQLELCQVVQSNTPVHWSCTRRSFITALQLRWAINHIHIILIILRTLFDFISFIIPTRKGVLFPLLLLIQGQRRTPLHLHTALTIRQHCEAGDLPASLTTRQDCSSCQGINTVICHRLHTQWDTSYG